MRETDPQSAYPKYDGNSFVVEPEVYGTKVDVDTFKAKVKDAITNFKSCLLYTSHFCNIRSTEEVDEFFCMFLILCIFWNNPGINPKIRTFLKMCIRDSLPESDLSSGYYCKYVDWYYTGSACQKSAG